MSPSVCTVYMLRSSGWACSSKAQCSISSVLFGFHPYVMGLFDVTCGCTRSGNCIAALCCKLSVMHTIQPAASKLYLTLFETQG